MLPAAPALDVHGRFAAPNAFYASAPSRDSARAANDDVWAAPAVRRPVIGDTSDADNVSAPYSGAALDNVHDESAAARVVPNAATNIPSSDSPDATFAAATTTHPPNDDDVALGDHNDGASAAPDRGSVNGEDEPTAAPDAHVVPRTVTDITPTPADDRPNADVRPLPDAPDGDQHGAVVHDASSPTMQNPTSSMTTPTTRLPQTPSFVLTLGTMRPNQGLPLTTMTTPNPPIHLLPI